MTALPKGIGRPATGALEHHGVSLLEDVTRLSESELLALHGVGPKAVRVLKSELAQHGLTLAPNGPKGPSATV